MRAGTTNETLGTAGVYGDGRTATPAFAITIAAAVVAGAAVRAWVLGSPLGALDSDEAISGLIARHMLDGEFSALYWLGNYGGTLESAVAAVVFAVFGSSVLTLKLTSLALFALAGVLTWRVGLRTVGHRAALAGAALMWVWPAYLVWWTTKARAFYAMGLVLGLVVFLFALRLRERDSRLDAAALGAALGLGWWTTPGVLVLALPALLWVAWRRPRAFRLVPFAVPGFVVGVLPWVAWNVRNGWLSLDLSPVAAAESTFGGRLVDLFRYVLPTWLGVRVPFSLDWTLGAVLGWVIVVAALAALVLLVVRRPSGVEPLLVAAVLFPFLYALSKFTYYVAEPRYVVYFAPIPALLLGRVLVTPLRAAVAFGAALALTVAGLVEMERTGEFHPSAQDVPVPARLDPVLHLLEAERQRYALANYWIAYRLTFESDERVIATSTGFVRYQPHDRLVRRSSYPARVYVHGSTVEERARSGLLARGYRRKTVGGFVVYVRH
ncbi:MAG TPA: glycosyltransferase family 39 protein [Gaiellaceae bacterium]|nr:glycosyltransferase family 39 protein [Gaiellaceae bacterium]